MENKKHDGEVKTLENTNVDVVQYDPNEDPNEGETEPTTKKLLMGIIQQLRMGMEIAKIIIPCEFLEARSLLERLADLLTHCDIVERSVESNDPLQRMVEMTRWYLSGWHMNPKGVKKPYNPVLGEFYRCNYVTENGTLFTYFAEQVSHHPPISAFFAECPSKRIWAEGWYKPKNSWMGNSACSVAEGVMLIHSEKRKETYECTWPVFYFRNLIFGKLFMEMCGTPYIKCLESNLESQIEFKPKPWFGGEMNHVECKIKNHNKKGKTIYRIKGKYDEMLYIRERKKSKVKDKEKEENEEKEIFFDPIRAKRMKKGVIPLEKQRPFESQVLWKDLTDAIKKNDIPKASESKFKVEQAQRDRKKKMDEQGIVHKPKFFRPGENNFWHFIGRDSEEYQEILKPL